MTLAPGTTVGRYQILEPLGQGGMATVYKAFQPSLQREVALKVLRPGYAQDAEFRERFEREAIAIAKLRHPHIVQVFDFEIASSGEYVLAMEFLEGGTLKERLSTLAAEGRGTDPAVSVRILSEVAAALSYAHEKGVIHRDVKPSNVMLTQKDWAVVTDFGIARILGATSHTQTGVGIGTPEYMAPEQGQGAAIDHRADIYSLGALAYELLTGRVPYSADTPLAVVLAHIKDPLPLPSRVNPTIGKGVEKALLRALAKDPAQRFETATAFAEALTAGLAEDTKGGTMPTVVVRGVVPAAAATAQPAPVAPKQVTRAVPSLLAQRPVLTGAAAALVLALVAGGVVAGNAFRAAPQASSAPSAAPTQPAGPLATAASPASVPTAAAAAPATPTLPPLVVATLAPTVAPTVAPTPKPPHAIPAKGPLLWQASLNGTSSDVADWTIGDGQSAANTQIRYLPGAIEIAATSANAGGYAHLNMPIRTTYVGELDLASATTRGADVKFIWQLRACLSDRLRVTVNLGQEFMELVDLDTPNPTTFIPNALTPTIPVPGAATGKAHTIAAVLTTERVTLFLDEAQVADVPFSRCQQTPRWIIDLEAYQQGAPATVRITGARLYNPP